jgi:GNAT superfamily N-acetyltransferase
VPPSAPDFSAGPAEPRHLAELSALFEANGSPCYCRYWHFDGDKNDWLGRCANAPERNRTELEHELRAHELAPRGVVAEAPARAAPRSDEAGSDAARVVGWMRVAPAVELAKAYDQRLYRGLSCFGGRRDGVWLIGCFLIDEAWRRRGVATALVEAGIALARTSGARALEAFPRRANVAHDAELWTGTASTFERLGFEEVHAFAPYPVFRLMLGN